MVLHRVLSPQMKTSPTLRGENEALELFFEVPVQDDRIAGVATPNGMVLPNRALFV